MLLALLAGVLIGLPAHAESSNWNDVRQRSGNDDLFIMVDTSLSMSEAAGGIMPQVRSFLGELFTNYLKTGDRVILMTFDSDAHLHSVFDVENAERDRKMLQALAQGIDSRRAIYLAQRNGVLREVPRNTPGAVVGGGEWTDYCAMWKLAQEAMERYSDPRRRQLFLLFTDGTPEAPVYRPCERPEVLETFASGVRKDLFGMGVVALPSGDQESSILASRLRELLRSIGSDTSASANGNFKVIECDANRGMGPVQRQLRDILYSRVTLDTGSQIDLGAAYKPRLPKSFTITNRSAIARTIRITSATVTLGPTTQPVQVRPPELQIAPGGSATIQLETKPFDLPPGEYSGSLEFFFSSPSRFIPSRTDLHVRQQTWWEAYGRATASVLVATVLGLLLILLWLAYRRSLEFAPALVEARYGTARPYPTRSVQIGEQVAFGGGGSVDGQLFVDMPGAPRGLLIREAVDSWKIIWDTAREPRAYSPGATVHPDPYATDGWRFMVTLNQQHTLAGLVALFMSAIRKRPGVATS